MMIPWKFWQPQDWMQKEVERLMANRGAVKIIAAKFAPSRRYVTYYRKPEVMPLDETVEIVRSKEENACD